MRPAVKASVVAVAIAIGALALIGCGPEVRTYERDGFAIHHFITGITNTWAVDVPATHGFMIVDVGSKGDVDGVLASLAKIGKKPSDVTLVVMTHGHFDHGGASAALKKSIAAPFAIGRDDVALAKSGVAGPPDAQILEGDLLRPFFDPTFPPWTPDIALDGGERLDAFGIPGAIVVTPGHTPGSVSVVLDDGEAFVGDLARGVDEGSVKLDDGSDQGHMGRASTSYYSANEDADVEHLAQLLDGGARFFFPGHGPWFADASLRGFVTDHVLR